jgi:hypothetical protein
MDSKWTNITDAAPEPQSVILWASDENYRPVTLLVVASRPGLLKAVELASMMVQTKDYRTGHWYQLTPPIPKGLLRDL